MAGIGVRLNKIFSHNTLTTNIYGMGYGVVATIAPMLLVIGAIILMQFVLGVSRQNYASRELFAATVLYVFIFSLLTASPLSAVLSQYMSDIIYEEAWEDIMPCYYVGLIFSVVPGALLGVPFCLWEYFVGEVGLHYVFAGFGGYMTLILIFYTMLYLLICKDYRKISLFFFFGMLLTVILSLILVYLFRWEVSFAMLVSLDVGFLLIAALETSLVKSYFRQNSGRYKRVFQYFKNYWKLIFTNFLYVLGLYIHNFVFWTTDMRMIVVRSFVMMQPYDMATCLAMFTNISASVIFIARVEMHFHERYRDYSEMVIGGRGMDIEYAKSRMFRQLGEELHNLVRLQFIVSVVVFFIAIIVLPMVGFGGMVLRIYPCLAAGYFIMFIMYSAIIFLYYFGDLTGALLTALSFCLVTLLGSLFSSHLPDIWYGLGLVIGSFVGWCMAYARLRWVERNLDVHIFCRGNILQRGYGLKPSSKVFDRYQEQQEFSDGMVNLDDGRFLFHSESFTETAKELRNPARGWYQVYPFQVEREPDFEELKWCLKEDETCALVLLDIGAYRDRDLDGSAVEHIRRILAFFDEYRKDIILRAVYDREGKGIEHEPSRFAQVTAHITQLGPVLQEYSKRIILFEGMLVGNWGEMHGSKFLSKQYMLRLNEALANSAKGIVRAVRRPAQWRTLHPEPPGSGTAVGLYNDAVFGSNTDLGTFAQADNPDGGWEELWSVRRELTFEEELSAFVPQCGEAVCGETYRGYTLADTVARLRKMGMTYLNGVYDENILNIWKTWTWITPGEWQGMSGYDYIGRHLGYRFCVRNATAWIGMDFCDITLTVQNVGFSGFYQEAEVRLMLTDRDGQEKEYLTDWDIRAWKSGQTISRKWRIPCCEGKIWLSVRRKWDQETVWFANESTEQGWVYVGELKPRALHTGQGVQAVAQIQ